MLLLIEKDSAVDGSVEETKVQAEKHFLDLSYYLAIRALNLCSIPQDVQAQVSKIWCSEYESLENSINCLRSLFKQEFKELYCYDLSKVWEWKESRIKFILSRCLAICDEPSYDSFVFACAFIFHMVLYWFNERNCYQIIHECQFCLYSLYKRKLMEIFHTLDDYEKFKSFCEDVDESLSSKIDDGKLNTALDSLPDSGQTFFEMIERCVIATDEDFSPTLSDLEFWGREKETRNLNKIEGHFRNAKRNICDVKHSSEQSVSGTSLDKVTGNQMDINDRMEFLSDICEFCGGRCGM
ncbi:hypothetical protein NPIL_237291 [Nephila pilipes]|uniref:Uncharacterized protein n=1 Tax=Nephila pilipes TaxID=299642 RepID=A0A8X6NDK9_NEPPI|nr:hypothetical protein NPIL_237291 [Nephila pilipes]